MMKNRKLILASQSPRRKYLLEQAGIDFTVEPADIEETPMDNESPSDYVTRLSREKADDIARRHPDAWVIGADTIVVIDGMLLEKPTSRNHAREMLTHLSNRIHTVYTGFTLCCAGENKSISRCIDTAVLFKDLSETEIEWYINTDEPFDKAGAYAIQGLGTFLVRSINGSYTNVVGLPVCEVIELLMQEKVVNITA